MLNVTQPDAYAPDRGIASKVLRRLTQYRAAAPLTRSPDRAIISFTFDDFPKSAAEAGADILGQFGVQGCFYACAGMIGATGPCGVMYDETDLANLLGAGHEIGAHTQTHLDCARAPLKAALADIDAGRTALEARMPGRYISQFAYPYGETRFELKRALSDRYAAARGVLGGLNGKGSDRMQLRAVEIDADAASVDRALAAIADAVAQKRWLILFTHDVRAEHSPWGTTPERLTAVVRAAAESGAALLTPSEALQEIEGGGR